MSDQPTFDEIARSLRDYLNTENRAAVLATARVLASAPWTQTAEVTAIDAQALEVVMSGADSRRETRRVAFARPAQDADELRLLLMELADRADPADGLLHAARARVATPKASRYLKALCNHFDRKAEAVYDDHGGRIRFPFGECELQAEADALLIRVSADSTTRLRRVQHVVADHLVRFAPKEELVVNWDALEPVPAAVP